MSIVTKCYQNIFGKLPEKEVIVLIERADYILTKDYDSVQIKAIEKAIEKNLDLECLEYLVRRIKLNNPLTMAFKIAVSVGECSPQYYKYFTNATNNRLAVGYTIILAVLHLVKCMIKKPFYIGFIKDITHA